MDVDAAAQYKSRGAIVLHLKRITATLDGLLHAGQRIPRDAPVHIWADHWKGEPVFQQQREFPISRGSAVGGKDSRNVAGGAVLQVPVQSTEFDCETQRKPQFRRSADNVVL